MAELSARLEHAGDFVEETWEIRIAMRCLDIQDGVETAIGERELLGVANLETQAFDLMPRLAMPDTFGIEIQSDIFGGPISPGEIRRSAAMSAADLKHAPAGQGDVPADMLIELDIGAVRFVSGG